MIGQGKSSGPAGASTVADVACVACGCLCDDLVVALDGGGRVVEVRNGCHVGRDWFLGRSEDAGPAAGAAVEGVPADAATAIGRAASVLTAARAPVVFGLTRTSTETARAALALADRLGARVVLDRSAHDLGRVAAFQNAGRVGATLGAVKNRADLVIFWNVDPVRTHPRHFERYSAEAPGRFVPGGRAGRTVVAVDAETTATAEQADAFVRVSPDRCLEALLALRMLVRGRGQDPSRLDEIVGWAESPRPTIGRPLVGLENSAHPTQEKRTLHVSSLESLAARMKGARYGALFFQGDPRSKAHSARTWEAASKLVRDLNASTRFVLLGMGTAGNLAGAEAALSWQGGFLQGVDYRLGCPSPLDDAATLDEVLTRREADALVVVAEGWPPAGRLESIPTILIGPGATAATAPPPTVALAASTAGFDAAGTVTRADGVVLPLRPVRAPSMPGDGDLIRAILDRLGPRKDGLA